MKYIMMCTNCRDEFFKLTALHGETYEVVDGSDVIETCKGRMGHKFRSSSFDKIGDKTRFVSSFHRGADFCREHRIRSKFKLVRCKSITCSEKVIHTNKRRHGGWNSPGRSSSNSGSRGACSEEISDLRLKGNNFFSEVKVVGGIVKIS